MVVLGNRRSLLDRRHRRHCEWLEKERRSGLGRHINHGGVSHSWYEANDNRSPHNHHRPTTTTTTSTLPPTTTTTSTPSAVVPDAAEIGRSTGVGAEAEDAITQAGFKVEMVPTSSPSCYFTSPLTVRRRGTTGRSSGKTRMLARLHHWEAWSICTSAMVP